jgi:uncharacterized damage-inducible protein DinB
MLDNLWKEHSSHRSMVIRQLQKIPIRDLRKRSDGNKWSVEELLRHILQADEWWYHVFLLESPKSQIHSLGIAKETQAAKWASLAEIGTAFSEFDGKFTLFLEAHPDIEELIDRPKYEMQVSLKWVFYHLIQHELETLGMVAERVRSYGYSTPWEF